MAEDSTERELTQSAPPDGITQGESPAIPAVIAQTIQRLEAATQGLALEPLPDRLEVSAPVDRLLEVCTVLRDDLCFGLLMSITAVDHKSSFELVYHLFRLDSPYPVVIRCSLPHEDSPTAPSLVPLWPGADFQEREIFDLMGIVFAGHPNMRRILLDDDFPGHPLRKDFQVDPDYPLVRHLRLPGYPGPQPGAASTGRFANDE